MTNHVLLNNIDHGDLRVIADRSAALGDAMMYAPCFPFEFRRVQAHYPILFQQDPASGDVQAVALFGFERGENLFLSDAGWEPAYIPASVERQPFLIGLQSDPERGGVQTVIHLDAGSPRVSRTRGVPLFLEHGGTTPFMDRIAAILEAVHAGVGEMRGFATALTDLGLLESLAVDIELDDGSKNRLVGFHAIDEDKVAALPGDKLHGLHAHGLLMPLYMALASLSQLKPLIDRKNAKIRQA